MKKKILIVFCSVFLLIILWQNYDIKKPIVNALWLEEPRNIGDFHFTTHMNSDFSQVNLMNHWTILFIGYTGCPDICPNSFQNLNSAYKELKSIQNNLNVVFLSVDPKRDTTDKLASYIGFFNDNFIAMTGNEADIYYFTQKLNLVYMMLDNPYGGDYLVDHSVDFVLINPEGKLEAMFKSSTELAGLTEVSKEVLIEDFKKITRYQSKKYPII